MEDTPLPPVQETQEAPMSLGSKLFNIYASPAEVFDDLKNRPINHLSWIVATIILALTTMIFTFVAFSQPKIIEQQTAQMRASMTKSFDKMVSSGKMSQQQADEQVDNMVGKISLFMKWLSPVTAMFSCVAMIFLNALILWLIAKFALKVPLDYMRLVELAALTSMITALGSVIGVMLVAHYEDMYRTLGPSLLLPTLDPKNPVHIILSSINLIMIWFLIVQAMGLAKLASKPLLKPAAWLFGIWCVLVIGSASLVYLSNQISSHLQ